MSKYLDIHTLRSRCDVCKVDTMRTFVLKDNENPKKAFEQMEHWVKLRFPKDHNCIHTVNFRWSTDKHYLFNKKTKRVEKVK